MDMSFYLVNPDLVTFEDGETGTVVDVTDADGSIETSGDDAEADAQLNSQDGVSVHLNDKIRYRHHSIKWNKTTRE